MEEQPKANEVPVSVEPQQSNVDAEPVESRESESGRFSEQNLNDTPEADDIEDEGPKSSAENIIPLDKLKNGWLAVSGFVMSTANKVKTTAVDTYNSEQVANLKRRTSEVVTPAWEKTCEVAAPAWEKTCEVAAPIWSTTCSTASVAVEKTKEGAVSLTQTVADRWKLFTTKKTTDPNSTAPSSGADGSVGGAGADLADVPPPAPAGTHVPVSTQPTHSELDSAPTGPVKGPPTIV